MYNWTSKEHKKSIIAGLKKAKAAGHKLGAKLKFLDKLEDIVKLRNSGESWRHIGTLLSANHETMRRLFKDRKKLLKIKNEYNSFVVRKCFVCKHDTNLNYYSLNWDCCPFS